jgi:hypothetical protein
MIIDTTLDRQKAVRKDGFYRKLNQKDQHYADVGRNHSLTTFRLAASATADVQGCPRYRVVWDQWNQHEASGMNERDEIPSDATLLSAFTSTTAAVHERSRKGLRTACRRTES